MRMKKICLAERAGILRESERHDAICAFVEEKSFASVRDLELHLGVSASTIRRDIDKLDETGRLRKVYGGVATPSDTDNQLSARSFVENADIAVNAKLAIARAAAALVHDGDHIILNGGSTVHAFARQIARRPLNVFTNSVPVIALLGEIGVCSLSVAGGSLHRESGLVFDDQGDQSTPRFASRMFTGAQGVSGDGLLESHPMLVRILRQLTSWADEVIVLCDSRKFDIRPRHIALPLNRIHTFVTDSGLRDQDASLLEREGIALIIADDADI